MARGLCDAAPLFVLRQTSYKQQAAISMNDFKDNKEVGGMEIENSRRGIGDLMLMLELRKRIINFRDMIGLPHCYDSAAIAELIMRTIEDLNQMYPTILPNIKEMNKEVSLNQELSYLYEALKSFGDISAKSHQMSSANVSHSANKLGGRVIEKLDNMIKSGRRNFDIKYEDGRSNGNGLREMSLDVKRTSPSPVSTTSIPPAVMKLRSLADVSNSLPPLLQTVEKCISLNIFCSLPFEDSLPGKARNDKMDERIDNVSEAKSSAEGFPMRATNEVSGSPYSLINPETDTSETVESRMTIETSLTLPLPSIASPNVVSTSSNSMSFQESPNSFINPGNDTSDTFESRMTIETSLTFPLPSFASPNVVSTSSNSLSFQESPNSFINPGNDTSETVESRMTIETSLTLPLPSFASPNVVSTSSNSLSFQGSPNSFVNPGNDTSETVESRMTIETSLTLPLPSVAPPNAVSTSSNSMSFQESPNSFINPEPETSRDTVESRLTNETSLTLPLPSIAPPNAVSTSSNFMSFQESPNSLINPETYTSHEIVEARRTNETSLSLPLASIAHPNVLPTSSNSLSFQERVPALPLPILVSESVPSPQISQVNQTATPGPPPPPPPAAGDSRFIRLKRSDSKLRRSSHMGNLYRSLKRKLEGFNVGGPTFTKTRPRIGGAANAKLGMADALAEMTKRSAYFHQIEEDVQKHSQMIIQVKDAINSFKTKDMDELVKFHRQVEQHLEKLSDESQVLARFEDFPTKKLESLRTAAALHLKLEEIAFKLKNWKIDPPLGKLLDKVESYFNKIKADLEALDRSKDEDSKHFRSHDIDFDFKILIRIKELMVDVSSSSMEFALKERREANPGKRLAHIKLLWRAFQLAFRVYTFAGGQDDRADRLTKELGRELSNDPQNN